MLFSRREASPLTMRSTLIDTVARGRRSRRSFSGFSATKKRGPMLGPTANGPARKTGRWSLGWLRMANVKYFVSHMEETIAFYTQNLGFSLEENFGPFAIVSKEDLRPWLSDPRTSAARPMTDGRFPEPGAGMGPQPNLSEASFGKSRAAGYGREDHITAGRVTLVSGPAYDQ